MLVSELFKELWNMFSCDKSNVYSLSVIEADLLN